MRNLILGILAVGLVLGVTGCGTVPVQATGAGEFEGRDLGSGQATESSESTSTIGGGNIINMYGPGTVRVNTDGSVDAEVRGTGPATFNLQDANNGVLVGDRSSNPSGGTGGSAAGGTGGAERSGQGATATGTTEEPTGGGGGN